MPFVVFIAPPGLEQLKSVSREMGNTLRVGESNCRLYCNFFIDSKTKF